jgi:cytochrome c-type biogenesis protein CcmH
MRLRIAAGLALTALAMSPAVALATYARASLTDVEADLMCTECHEPLALSQSTEAIRERALVRTLIAQGLDKAQIEHQMVLQYGPAVLARPPAHGFNLTVYILPPTILLAGLATLAYLLPRWRRRTPPATAGSDRPSPGLSPPDARRLEDELSRFPG